MAVKTKKLFPLFCLFMLICTTTVGAVSNLNITVTTDKQSYSRFESVQVYGNLVLDSSPVTDGLVALLVKNPSSNYIVMRTVNTGMNPQSPLIVEVRSVYSCDLNGNPKPDVSKGSLAYFNVTISNYDLVTHIVLATVNLYDKNNVALSLVSSNLPIPARSASSFIISASIPSWATSGNAAAYASAYTEWPEAGGTPYCPEESASFNILGGSSGPQPSTPNGSQGAYNLTFRLPPKCQVGTYVVYASSIYNGMTALANTVFFVKQPGDFDGDGDIDSKDIFAFLDAYIAYWSGNPWNPEADFDFDGDVDSSDVFAFVDAYIQYWST